MSLKRWVPQPWLKTEARLGDIYHVNGLCAGVAMALDVLKGAEELRVFLAQLPPEATERMPVSQLETEEAALEFLYIYAKWKKMGNMLGGFQLEWLIKRNWPSDPISDHMPEIEHVWTHEMIFRR